MSDQKHDINTVDFHSLSSSELNNLVDAGIRHSNKLPSATDYLKHWIAIGRHFGYATQDDSWGEFEKEFAIIIGRLVAAENELRRRGVSLHDETDTEQKQLTVHVMGASGLGKTTLIALFQKTLEAEGFGNITINGIDEYNGARSMVRHALEDKAQAASSNGRLLNTPVVLTEVRRTL